MSDPQLPASPAIRLCNCSKLGTLSTALAGGWPLDWAEEGGGNGRSAARQTYCGGEAGVWRRLLSVNARDPLVTMSSAIFT